MRSLVIFSLDNFTYGEGKLPTQSLYGSILVLLIIQPYPPSKREIDLIHPQKAELTVLKRPP